MPIDSGSAFARQAGTPVALATDLFAFLAPLVSPALPTMNPAGDPPAIESLHRTWCFVRRTALPARAPDRLA